MKKVSLKINRNNDEIIISFEDFKKNWYIKDNFLEMRLKIGVPYLMDFSNHFTLLNEEKIDLVDEIRKQVKLEAIYENNIMIKIGKIIDKSNIVENIITQGFNSLKRYEGNEFILLNHLKTYLLKYHINCCFNNVFRITDDAQDIEPNSYSHWVLYLEDFELFIDLDGIYEYEKYIKKIAIKYNHDKDLVGYMKTEPVKGKILNICYENLIKWFEFCNLSSLMLEDNEFKKYLKVCSIVDTVEPPF
ncbi:hypothetical protein [Aliarcobacter butzleri]|uniref:hypothetical protein n=1 Tax=Aliarcobacter butzleri TaxID=28197 RepID=UPI002B24B72C|nr:hypothetical protein [Aliarcobacter butzleri]